MKSTFKKLFAIATVGLMLAQGAALADSITFDGTVVAGSTHEIYAPIGGTVWSVEVEAGQSVVTGDVLATLKTTKVYAKESGVVTGLFGQPGDSADVVAQKYGAVMYIEGESLYTISASTDQAYDETDNKFVHVGEEVYLSCYSDGSHTGTGVITSLSGTDYTVRVLTGEFVVDETISIYRGTEAKAVNRIGRGDISRTSPTAVTGSGSIVSYAVANGDTVQRGDLLFETLNGEFDGYYMSGNQILAETDGVIAEVNLSQGGKVEKDSVAAVVYPKGSMRIEAQIQETNLSSIAVGDPVSIELIWNQDEEVTYTGTIAMISSVATSSSGSSTGMTGAGDAGSSEVTYTVYIDFTPDEHTRYGMSAIVSTMDEEFAEEAVDEQE